MHTWQVPPLWHRPSHRLSPIQKEGERGRSEGRKRSHEAASRIQFAAGVSFPSPPPTPNGAPSLTDAAVWSGPAFQAVTEIAPDEVFTLAGMKAGVPLAFVHIWKQEHKLESASPNTQLHPSWTFSAHSTASL